MGQRGVKDKTNTVYKCFKVFIFIDFYAYLHVLGMFKNNEAFHLKASHAHVCLDFNDQT